MIQTNTTVFNQDSRGRRIMNYTSGRKGKNSEESTSLLALIDDSKIIKKQIIK